ncbi:hypothetical protein FACS189427_09790 [Planctomycetales bacterium]|nr:hypothetical protein FACS189427_09790 [Planctomycetales bacterium]
MSCVNQMKQIMMGIHNYYETYHSFPPAYTIDSNGQPLHSWRVLILPHLGEENLYKQIRLDEPWDSEYNKQFHSQMPDIFCCPSMKQADSVFSALKEQHHNLEIGCCYSIVIGKETPFPGSESTQPESIDDKENTVLIVERMVPVNWMNPMSDMLFETASCGVNAELTGIGSTHHGGCNCAMADAGVKFIADSIETSILKEMLKLKKDKNLNENR